MAGFHARPRQGSAVQRCIRAGEATYTVGNTEGAAAVALMLVLALAADAAAVAAALWSSRGKHNPASALTNWEIPAENLELPGKIGGGSGQVFEGYGASPGGMQGAVHAPAGR